MKCPTCVNGSGWILDWLLAKSTIRRRGWEPYYPCQNQSCPRTGLTSPESRRVVNRPSDTSDSELTRKANV